jgi:hypothetical protein
MLGNLGALRWYLEHASHPFLTDSILSLFVVSCVALRGLHRNKYAHEFANLSAFDLEELDLSDSADPKSVNILTACLPALGRKIINRLLQGHDVLIHCVRGANRSLAVACAFFITHLGLQFHQAFEQVSARLSFINPAQLNLQYRSVLAALSKSVDQALSNCQLHWCPAFQPPLVRPLEPNFATNEENMEGILTRKYSEADGGVGEKTTLVEGTPSDPRT